jgi:hypothetical protein
MTMLRDRAGQPLTLVLAAVAVVAVMACSAVGPSTSPSATPAGAGTARPSVADIPSPTPSSVIATAEPTSPAPPTPEPPMPEPPAASLQVEGGDPVIGALGAFTWMNGGSAAPWLPGRPIHVGRGEQLTFALAESVAIASWTVSRSPGAAVGTDIVGMADGTGEPLTFDAPPTGSWSVAVEVRFEDNLGSAAYFWLVEVD